MRRAWRGLFALMAGCLIAVTACGGERPGPPDQSQPPTPAEQQDGDGQPQSQPDGEMVRERVLTVTSDDVGAHLEPRSYAAGLPSWLEAAEARELSTLPGRALAVSGIAFSPSDDSPTEETLWLHVFTDESEESAVDWVKYVGSQPPELMSIIVPHHELFAASFLPAPVVGDISIAIELYHGHGGICVRSSLLVFAQERVLVFLFNSIEITGQRPDTQAEGALPAHCEVRQVASRLTDINAIAQLISERLSVDP